MTESELDWTDYWALFTDAGGIIQSNAYYSEWTARQFKRVMEQKTKGGRNSRCKAFHRTWPL